MIRPHTMLVVVVLAWTAGCPAVQGPSGAAEGSGAAAAEEGAKPPASPTPARSTDTSDEGDAPAALPGVEPAPEVDASEPRGVPDAAVADESEEDEPVADADEPSATADCPENVLHGDVGDDVPFDPGRPPLATVTEVTGNVTIGPHWERETGCLRRVGGNLTFSMGGAPITTSLSGLGRLEVVAGDLLIDDGNGDRLVGVQGLTSLRSVGGDFTLHAYWATSLHGLEQLESVGGDLALTAAVYLQSLSGLSGLRRVGGSLLIMGTSGDAFEDLQGLEGLRELGGLELTSTQSLTSLRGLPSFTHFTRSLIISGARSLTSLDGLGELRRIDGKLRLEFDEGLTDLSALGKLEQTGSLELVQMPTTSLSSFSALKTIEGQLAVSATPLASLAGLDQLTELGSLFLDGSNLAALGPLHVSTMRALTIHDSSITSLDGLQELTEVSESIELRGNLALKSLTGLEGLARVGGDFFVQQSPALRGVAALASLREVGGALALLELGVSDLGALDGLRRVGSLMIGGNDFLTELATPEQLELTGALSVWGNAALSRCDAAALATTLSTTCACPEGSTPECTPGCRATRLGYVCELCQGLQYCQCQGPCDCTGNDNTASTCTP